MDLLAISFILTAYLFGSVSAAILVCRLMGLEDPRKSGSKNPGATNVLRLGGKKAALLTLLGDSLKGVIPVLIARISGQPEWLIGATAVAAFVGHLFPVFFQFKGGKGVATFFGVLFVLNSQLGVYASLSWLICAWTFRISSISALLTAMTVPVFAAYFFPEHFVWLTIICVLLVARHHHNIRNLITGHESKIGRS